MATSDDVMTGEGTAREERRRAKDLKSAQEILQYASKSFSTQLANFDALDSKAAIIAGFTGVIVTVASGFASGALKNWVKDMGAMPGLELFTIGLFMILVLCLTGSFWLAVRAIAARRIKNPARVDEIIAYYRASGPIDSRHRRLVKGMIKTISRADNDIRDHMEVKADLIKKSTALLQVSVIVGIFEITSYVLLLFQRP